MRGEKKKQKNKKRVTCKHDLEGIKYAEKIIKW